MIRGAAFLVVRWDVRKDAVGLIVSQQRRWSVRFFYSFSVCSVFFVRGVEKIHLLSSERSGENQSIAVSCPLVGPLRACDGMFFAQNRVNDVMQAPSVKLAYWTNVFCRGYGFMVSKVFAILRLMVGGLALLGAQTASAGLMLTIDTLQDFQFDEMKVEYNPGYHSLDVTGDSEFSLSGDASPGTSDAIVGDLYLTATVTDEGAVDGAFEVFGKLDPTDDPSVLLAGSLEQIQVDRGAGYFVFLTQGNSVNADFASKYLDNGVQVSFRVTKLGGTALIDAFGAPTAVGALANDQSSPQPGAPVPVPATIALFLIAALPLAATRCRR